MDETLERIAIQSGCNDIKGLTRSSGCVSFRGLYIIWGDLEEWVVGLDDGALAEWLR